MLTKPCFGSFLRLNSTSRWSASTTRDGKDVRDGDSLTERGTFLGSGFDSDDGLDGVALYHEFKFNCDGEEI